ncbi:ATP-binding protein [Lacinutrix salivirga]
MKIVCTFIFLLFFITNVFAQKQKDSLNNIWHNIKLQDSTRFEAMRELIEDHYLYTKTDSALVLGKQMLNLAKNKKHIKFQIQAKALIGRVNFELGEFSNGEKIYYEALELAKTESDSLLYVDQLFDLGHSYYEYDDYTNAFKTYQQTQKLYKELGDGLNEGWSVAYQGFIYKDLGDYREAEKCHLHHLQLSKKYNIKRSISGANGNLGRIYYEMGDVPKSIKYWKEGIRQSKELGLPEYASVGTGNLINIYINEKNYVEATKYLEEYKAVTKQFATLKYTKNFALKVHLWQCQIDYGLSNYTKALKECEDCLKIHIANNWDPDSDLLKSLYEVNKKLNRHGTALDYFEKYQIAIDDEKEDKARTEIQNIVFKNQIISDSIAQDQENQLLNITYQEGLRKKNREKNLFLVIGLLVLLSAIAYFLISRKIEASKRKRLQEINQLKNALFTNITHEFRTPLTVIKGMTDTVKSNFKNNKTEDIEKSLEMIERNSDNLLHLVNEMLDLSKIESGNMELQLVQSDVIPFLKYLSESFSSFAEENQINLTIYSEIDSLIMDFDGNKITSVISNLLYNAIKFTSEYGKIIVHINEVKQKDESYLFIKIKDSGIGIPKEELPNIFNRFYQTDASTIRKHEGTGIGLALTKELVELMQGTIKVNSTLDKGSEFSVMIPITRNAPKATEAQIDTIAISPVVKTSSKKTEQIHEANSELPLVLIIEDNMDVAHYLKTCLINKYETIHAVNGIEGIKMALEKIPDIIVCDVMMPEKDGFEVCETLKTDERSDHIPIIILTAKVTTEDRLTGLSHGADAYLAKPFNREELFTRLDQLVLLRKKLIHKIQDDGFNTLLKKRTEDPKLQFLKKVVKLIHKNISDSEFGSHELAKNLLISESQLYRKIKAITEKSTAVFIRSIRLQYAKELLLTNNKTVSEVAYEVGFNNPSWFSRAYKVEFGCSPSTASK